LVQKTSPAAGKMVRQGSPVVIRVGSYTPPTDTTTTDTTQTPPVGLPSTP
jgi:beta-lactam-binding protein with PASTA domain